MSNGEKTCRFIFVLVLWNENVKSKLQEELFSTDLKAVFFYLVLEGAAADTQ